MADAPPTTPTPFGTPAFVPTARPERHLVAAIAVIGLVCVALWSTGAVGARVTAVVQTVDADTVAGRGTLHVELRNDGPMRLEVRDVVVDDRGGPPVQVGTALVAGHPLAGDPVRVPGGGVVQVEVPYTVDCGRPTGYGADPELGVRVRAPFGTTQTRPIGTEAVYDSRNGGDDPVDSGPLLCPVAGRRGVGQVRSPTD